MTNHHKKTHFLSYSDIQQLIRKTGLNEFIKQLTQRIEQSFKDYGKGKIALQRRIGYDIKTNGKSTVEVMHAYRKEGGTCFKIVNYHPHNYQLQLPSVMGAVVYVDSQTGFPSVIADATLITAFRTGAATAVATKHLARQDSKVLGIIGLGTQGRTNLHAISQLENIKISHVLGMDINPQTAHSFKEEMSRIVPNIDIQITDSPEDIAKQSDILITATYPTKENYIKDTWIQPGTHINAIGADTCLDRELDTNLVLRSRIVCDWLDQALTEGEINTHALHLLNKNTNNQQPTAKTTNANTDCFTRSLENEYNDIQRRIQLRKIALEQLKVQELADIILNKNFNRKSEDITIFDSTGIAFEDLATIELLQHLSDNYNIGDNKEFIFIPKKIKNIYEEL
jgi:ornithine cyclodeaminase/alanine dehydrogenase-like protein (mu-crystallin family)